MKGALSDSKIPCVRVRKAEDSSPKLAVVHSAKIGRGLQEVESCRSTDQISAKLNRLLLDNRIPLEYAFLVADPGIESFTKQI
jgi:hypothetical protein